MKKIIYIASLILCGNMMSCSFLDFDSDVNHYNDTEKIFKNPKNCTEFVSAIYAYLPEKFDNNMGINGVLRECAIDDAEYVNGNAKVQDINNGNWSKTNSIDDKWADYYKAIRAANIFLTDGTRRTFDTYKHQQDYDILMAEYSTLEYETRFLRAFFHMWLGVRYGDVPIVTAVITQEDVEGISYSPIQDVFDFVIEECDSIIAKDVLPDSYENYGGAKETGRVTKGAVLALKAKAALFAASKLNNPDNDKELWLRAAEASHDVLKHAAMSGTYTLETDYNKVVNNRASRDLIFERRNGVNNTFERQNFPIGFEGGQTGICPTQNLVDCYQTINGYNVQLKKTGFVSDDPTFDPNNPYINRDQRFAATMRYNGSEFKGEELECWYGGKSGAQLTLGSKTGYYLKKYTIDEINLNPAMNTKREHVWVIFRLAEFYLNYAEAIFEYRGDMNYRLPGYAFTALEALNEIRLNSKMPAYGSGGAHLAIDNNDFMSKLRNERRVELAFEDHRFWDIRRWKIGKETQKEISACEITKEASGTVSYKLQLLEERFFEDSYNRYPYPIKERQ